MTAFPAPPAIWERLARAGLRTLAIDPYESRPPARLVRDVRLRLGLSRPRRAAALVAAARGRHAARRTPRREPARDGDLRPAQRPRAARAAREAHRRAGPDRRRRRRAAGPRALRPRLADVQRRPPRRHQFWDLSQLAEAPAARERALLRSALEDVYAEVDAAFGRVLAALPERLRRDRRLRRRDGRQQLARRPAAADARGGAARRPAAVRRRRRRRRARSGACARRSRPARAARSRRRCPTGWRWS